LGVDVQWLEKTIFHRELTEREVQALTDCIDVLSYAKDEAMMQQGSSGGAMYILRSGVAVIERVDHAARTRIGRAEEGSVVGDMSLMTGKEVSADVIALKDCEVYRMTRVSMAALMRSHQGVVFALFAYMLEHTANVIRRMNEEYVGMMNYISGGKV